MRRPRSFVVTGSLAAALVVASIAPARAEGPEADGDAEALIAKGIQLRERGKDDEALATFKRAFAKAPTARARAQVALAEQALGMWVAAEADLVAALAAERDPWITKNRAALEGALAVIRRHVGGLEVRGADGAEVLVDGVVLGTASPGGSFRVEAGRRTLEVRAKGHRATTRTLEIPAGGVARETVTLVPLAPSDPETTGGAPGAARPPAPPTDSDEGHGQRLLGWAFLGTGGALLATGGVGLLIRKGIVDEYNATCPGLGAAQPADCDEKIESARTWQTVSIVSLVAGGVFGLAGGALMLTAPSPERSRRAGVSCTPTGAVAWTCGLRF